MDLLRSVPWSDALIPVASAAEPADFNNKVRQPGTAFLHRNPNPSSHDWRGNEYWRKAIGDLLVAYRKICCYSGSWTKANVGGMSTPEDSSVDHFIPKSLAPAEAYEWANFRLARTRLNSRKGNHNDVLDPFILPERWFTLDFRSFLVFPNRALSSGEQKRVQKTIDRLRLNTDNDYVEERVGVLQEYCLGRATLAKLDDFWPFIASEMRAQDFDNVFLPSMQTVFRARARQPGDR